MTPAARISTAIELLDAILAGEPAERALTRWARASRFAGSKDRAAVRDLVYDALRRKRSLAAHGGAQTGRAVFIAHQHLAGEDLSALFTGENYAPAVPSADELAALARADAVPDPVALDYPDFLDAELRRSLGDDFRAVMQAMQSRAPVDLRVNRLKTGVAEAQNLLARELIFTETVPGAPDALRIIENARALNNSRAYTYGMVELQDISSQIVARLAAPNAGDTVLDYCAGGGGKTLALAALTGNQGRLVAHDVNPGRMKDLPDRARRAGAEIEIWTTAQLARAPKFDLVLADAPCSGAGAWRRNPDSKWRITQAGLAQLNATQDQVLATASTFVAPQGRLAYATCSVLACENQDRVAAFLAANPDWQLNFEMNLNPMTGGDGFYIAILARA